MQRVEARRPSGFGELLPEEQLLFNGMIEVIRKTYESFGFTPIETPAIELAEVLLAKGGGETDKQVYVFEHGKNKLALHFDLTVPLARYVAEHQSELVFPFRRYQIQKVWRAERAQKGRYREFTQCDIDIIGNTNFTADAEIVAVAVQTFRNLHIGDFLVRINNRKILDGFFSEYDLQNAATEILRVIDSLDKVGEAVVRGELLARNLISKENIELLFGLITIKGDPSSVLSQLRSLKIAHPLFAEGVIELEAVCLAIKEYKVGNQYYTIDCSIARGLDYYTGTIYETTLSAHPQAGSICSGGRYDNLTQNYSQQPLSGIGTSIGITRLFAVLTAHGSIVPHKSVPTVALVVCLEDQYRAESLSIAGIVRSRGISVATYPSSAKLAKQFSYADKNGIPFVLILGEEEMLSHKITVRKMSSGTQVMLSLDEVIALINSKQ